MPYKVGLLWHSFSSANLGVGALSLCNLKLIDEQLQNSGCELEYIVIGNAGHLEYVPEGRYTIRSFEFSSRSVLRNPLKIIRLISACDIIFDIGEGDSFSDIYGLPRFLKLLSSKLLARLFGVPVVMSPQTIGPFRSGMVSRLAGFSMRRCAQVLARDDQSMSVLDQLKVPNANVATDVAFVLDYTPPVSVEGSGQLIGLNVSGLLYSGGYTQNNQFGLALDYREFTHRIIEHFLAQENVELHLVPHVLPPGESVESDIVVSERLKSTYPQVVVAGPFAGPEAAKSYIAGMDCFLGARMHATIAAISSAVPVIPLAYSRKFMGLYSSIGYPHVIDMKSTDLEQAMERVTNLSARLPELRVDVSNSSVRANDRLKTYRAVLASTIQEQTGG